MSQIELLKEEPAPDAFTPLEEHQSQTPGTFFGGKPVLYYHCAGAQILVAKDQLDIHTAISSLISSEANGTAAGSEVAPSHSAAATGIINVWVTSENLILFNPTTKMGASIPYPTITLHATRQMDNSTEAVYMQLELANMDIANNDEDYATIELDIVPISTTEPDPAASTANGDSTESPTKLMYNAIVACTDLHPDPDEDEEQEEMMPALGSGGWITSENMADFVDDDGNFAGFGNSLGAGAGTRRTREDGDDEAGDAEDSAMNAEGDDGKDREDTKWQRTE